MAEFVEFNIERSVNELELLEKYNLLKIDEIKIVIKKRKAFEYKLRNVKKSKRDFLKYIKYEESLLRLIRLRRNKIGFYDKTEEIDHSIGRKILWLYNKVCYNNQGDIDLWFSYINFCKKINYKGRVSGLYSRMLQVHNKNEMIWIEAAKFEFNDNLLPDVSRKLFHRALRFIPESKLLWHEYFKMELKYSDKIRKRKAILEKKHLSDSNPNPNPNPNPESNPEDEDEPEHESAENNNNELCNNDAVLNGKLAIVVYQNAIKKFDNDVKFSADFIPICHQFDYHLTNYHKDYIYNDIKQRFPDSETAFDILAKRFINDGHHQLQYSKQISDDEKKRLKKIYKKQTIDYYQDLVNNIQSIDMYSYYIKFLIELFSKAKSTNPNKVNERLENVLKISKQAWEKDLLSIDLFKQWLNLLVIKYDEKNRQQIQDLIYKASNFKWGRDFDFWLFCLSFYIKLPNCNKDITRHFQRGLKKIKDNNCTNIDQDKIVKFWETYLNWSIDNLPSKEVIKLWEQVISLKSNDNNIKLAEYFKSKYLRIINSIYGIDIAREKYQLLKNNQPIVLNFFETMIDLEEEEERKMKEEREGKKDLKDKDYSFIRMIFEDIVHNFGQNYASLWLKYIEFELTNHQSPNIINSLYYRAVKTLNPEQCDKFVSEYSLLKIKLQNL